MKKVTIEELREEAESKSGIGPNVSIEFDPKQSIKMDITDVSSW